MASLQVSKSVIGLHLHSYLEELWSRECTEVTSLICSRFFCVWRDWTGETPCDQKSTPSTKKGDEAHKEISHEGYALFFREGEKEERGSGG